MRASRCLRVVLDREGRRVKAFQALDDVVVQTDVRDANPPVCRAAGGVVGRRHRAVEGRVDGKAVVVGGHLDLAGGAVHHRLVDPAVPVLQLVGAEAERPPEELVAETDAEERDPGGQHVAQQLDLVLGARRVTGAVGEEDPVRSGVADRPDLGEGRGRGQDVHLDPVLRHQGRRHGLDPEVDRGDGETPLAHRRDHVGLGRGDLGGEGRAAHLRRTGDHRQQLAVGPLRLLAREDADPHRAALAQVAGQGPGVDAADAHDALPSRSSSRLRWARQLDGRRAGSRTT